MEDNRNKATCVFCGHKNSVKNECGKLHLTKTGHLAAHHKCMQYSAGLGQYKSHHFGGFKVRQVEKEQNRGKKIYCCLKKCLASSKTGATAGCAWAYCRKSYHFLCAHRKGLTSRRLKKTPKKQAVMYLVFCKPEHKKKYLEMEEKKGYKNETQSESDGEQDSTSNDDDDDDDDDDDSSTDGSSTSDQKLFCKSSAMCPRKLSRKHRVTHKSPSKRKKSPLEDEDALSESAQRSQEYLLVLPADESTFKAKVDTVCQHLSNDWVIDITQMHIWSKMRPVPVEEKLMLSFIASIFEAVSCDSWNELRMLLLDAKFIQDKCDELQDNKLVQVLNMQGNADLKLSYVKAVIKRIRDLEDKILAEKKVRLVDMCSSHGVNYAVLKINKVTDPDHFIRDHLKMFCLHFLLNQNSPFVIASPEIESCDSQEELSVLEKWFTTCFQHVYKVLDFPKDEILYRLDARTDELYATFKSIVYSRETSKNDDDCLPVVIFVGKLNSDIIHFERYLEALGEKILATYSPRPVICIFPVSNFRSRLAPHIKVPVHCWSAYDPAFKPVNYIVASWKKSWLL